MSLRDPVVIGLEGGALLTLLWLAHPTTPARYALLATAWIGTLVVAHWRLRGGQK